MNRSSAEGWLGDGVGIEGDVIPHLSVLARLAGRAVRNEIAWRIRHLPADSTNKSQRFVRPYLGLRVSVTLIQSDQKSHRRLSLPLAKLS